MKKRLIAAAALIMILAVSVTGCSSGKKVGVNILEQEADFTGEFDMPKSKKITEKNALWVLTQFNENGFKIKTSIKTSSDDESVIESYRIDIFDVNTELFRYTDDSARLKEVKETGKFIIRGQDGASLAEYNAYYNGNYVLMISSEQNLTGDDISEDNAKLVEFFKSLEL